MCLYPKLIKNPKYKVNKKNGGEIPQITDSRIGMLPIGCGQCIECRKQEARKWQVRLLEDIKKHKNGKFITLTFSDNAIYELHEAVQEQLKKGIEKIERLSLQTHDTAAQIQRLKDKQKGYKLDNEIAKLAVRRFLERWRKEYKKSVRHWLVTELGHNGTENIHMHGIIWTDKPEEIERIWKYGFVWTGKKVNGKIVNYVNEQTVNYIVKYINKVDEIHKTYKPKVLTTSGIGANYIETSDAQKNKYKEGKTLETYRTRTGHKISLPIYYRNKIYTEEEREKLWIEKLDKEVRWVRGEKISVRNGDNEYVMSLKWHQQRNKELGYGDGTKDWDREKYELERRKLMQQTRIAKAKKNTA